MSPKDTALIVVDMQNAYASPEGYLDKAGFDIGGAAAVIGQIGQACEAARAAGVQVVYFQNGWDPAYVEAGGEGSPNWWKSNALKTMREKPELEGQLLAKGGWDYELVEALKPKDGDIVIQKPRYSAFFNTSLDSVLRASTVFGQQRFVVVSQRFHTERAIFLARRHGIEAWGYEADDIAGALGMVPRLREFAGRLRALWDLLMDSEPRHGGPPVRIGVDPPT